ncbi:MAG: hypothetical protein MUE72_01390 [Chitinophagaceae bacterium]|jgi:hypothetical protein|nr:hypothetical protein [Chitinophagaceae bacterium]
MSVRWLVIDENPKPDNYIPIFETTSKTILYSEKSNKVYDDKNDAIKQAQTLKDKYNVSRIKIFLANGLSENI